jgi:hypothetical protein
METARIKLQGIYSLLAGFFLLLGVPIYQITFLGPEGYQAPANVAFSQGNYGPLLAWISTHGSAFVIYRFLELIAFLLAIRLPLALRLALRGYGSTLTRWMVVAGVGGLGLFVAMIAASTVSFVNAAAQYGGQPPASATANDIVTTFTTIYFVEGLGQNTLGGALIASFLVCASLLIARSGKFSGLLVFFGLLVAALMAALAFLFAVSAPSAQSLPTPAILSFAVWLTWLGILLVQRARRLLAEPIGTATPASSAGEASMSDEENAGQPDARQEEAFFPQPLASQTSEPEPSSAKPEAPQ